MGSAQHGMARGVSVGERGVLGLDKGTTVNIDIFML